VNIDAVLNAAGYAGRHRQVTLMLADTGFKAWMSLFRWLPGRGVTPLPARTAFAAASLPAGALVMLDVVAAFPVE
jgi:enamine deaminase RidA (YjgF/YER057c/UK114 family)